jgi:hypothetical protein
MVNDQNLDSEDPQDPQYMWISDGKPIGNAFAVQHNSNAIWITNTGNSSNPERDDPYATTNTGNITIGTTTNGNGFITSPYSTLTFPAPKVLEQDVQGNKVVRAPQPSLEQILVEVAKILRDGGNILEVRDIFERHKLKLMDHDGEVVFDPKKDIKLEDKSL